jgi:hypothetical protein
MYPDKLGDHRHFVRVLENETVTLARIEPLLLKYYSSGIHAHTSVKNRNMIK